MTSARRKMRGGQGFTLVEVICVIAVVAVLAAMALPKFVNASREAHKAAVSGTSASFIAGVNLVQTKYRARRLTGIQDNVSGSGGTDIDTNALGWPTDTSDQNAIGGSAARCQRVWNWVLVPPPTTQTAAAGTADYRVTAVDESCTFDYRLDTTTRRIVYTSNTGLITVTNP